MHEVLPIWPNTGLGQVTLTLLGKQADGRPGVLVLPGGAYAGLADYEGECVAQRFADAGFNVAVLRYRLGSRGHRHPGMAHDALRAVRLLRSRGWSKVGILGFSAGGHLASTAAVHYGRFECEDDDLAGRFSARPDASILCYPVIDLIGAQAHGGSADNLLGPDADDSERVLLSSSRHVGPDTPPTFLWHTNEDGGVPAENSIAFALACREHGVPVEMHLYERGQHGVGLANGRDDRPHLEEVATWIDLAVRFAERHLRDGAA